MIMAKRRKSETLLKTVGPKIKISTNGHPMNNWIDSRSPISKLTIDNIKKPLRRTGIGLKQKNTEDDEFGDYRNNRINLLGKVDAELASNGWKTRAEVRVIGGNIPSIVGCDLLVNCPCNSCRQIQGKIHENPRGTTHRRE